MTTDDWPVISQYSWQQGVEDGELVEILKHRWPELTGGKPLLATIGIHSAFTLAAIMEVWNGFVEWSQSHTDWLFSTTMNSQTIWLIADETTFTILFPEEY